MTFSRSLLRVSAALSLVASLLACSHDHDDTGAGAAAADVLFEAEATDEALEALLAATPIDDPSQAAQLTAPEASAALNSETPARFSWTVGPTASLAPSHMDGLDLDDATAQRGGPELRWWSELTALVGPVREAHAHGTPVNGRGYLLVVENAEGEAVHRVFTLALEHTPSSDAWQQLASQPQPLRASVLNAIFENNRIASEGGPWQGPALELTIATP
jgi:hypothetical protein